MFRRIGTLCIVGLLTAAGGRALWLTFRTMAVATGYPVDEPPLNAALGVRYAGLGEKLKGQLGGRWRIGYLTSPHSMSMRRYFLANYAALPVVVRADRDHQFVLADMPEPAALAAVVRTGRWRVAARLGPGLALLEKGGIRSREAE